MSHYALHKDKLRGMKTDMAVVPAGCTKFVQPADVSWNRSFKHKFGELYHAWMAREDHERTAAGNMRAPYFDLVCSWISQTWESIPEEQVTKSFVSCGISNAIDGSDDEKIVALRGDEGAIQLLIGERTTELTSGDRVITLDIEEDEEENVENEEGPEEEEMEIV